MSISFWRILRLHASTNHIEDQAQLLRLLQIYLKGDAQAWFRDFEVQHAHQENASTLTFAIASARLIRQFQHVEDADKVWHSIQSLEQKESESVEDFLKKFNKLWEDLCIALDPEYPLQMIKKDRFIARLKATL